MRPLAIIGPTGTGKSQLALDFAERSAVAAARKSSTPTRCSCIAAWTSAPRSCPSRRAAASRTINSTCCTSPKPRPSPATSTPPPPTSRRSRPGERCRWWSAVRCSTSSRCSTTGPFPPPTRPCARDGSSGSPRSEWLTCTPSWPAATRPPRRRSCPPTAGARCAPSRWSSSPGSRSPRRRRASAHRGGTPPSSD